MGTDSTLGLPAGIPSDQIYALTPEFESGEPGLTGRGTPATTGDPFVRWVQKEISRAEPHVMSFREQAEECYRFRDGHQLSDEDLRILKSQGRPDTAINEIQKFIKFASGVERRTIQALIFAARTAEDQQSQLKGELISQFYQWWIDTSGANYERSLAFEDLLVCGMGFTDTWISRVTNPAGDPRYARIDPLQMFWPECDKQNLEGVKWLGRESFMDVDEAIRKWPDCAMFLRAAADGDANPQQFPDFGYGAKKPIPYVVPWTMTAPLNKGGAGNTAKPGKVAILEWQYYDDEDGYYFFDPLERTDAWLNGSDFRKYQRRLQALYKLNITDYDPQEHRVYKRAFLLQRRILLAEPAKLPTNGETPGPTWNCMTGSWDRKDKVWYGILRVLIAPQRYANAFFRQTLEVMGASYKGGGFAESNALTVAQKRDIEENGARPGAWHMVQPGAISQGKIKEKTPPQVPAGSLQVLQFCIDLMEKITGLSMSLLGTDQSNTPGVTLRRRLTSGLVLLAGVFDALSKFRRREGQIIFDFMKLIADDRIIRIGGAFDGRALPLTKAPFATKYDILLDENDQDPNLRQVYTDNLMSIAPILIRQGKFFPELLDYVNLPVQVRMKLKEMIQQQGQQAAQMAQMGISGGGRGKPRGIQDVQTDNMLKVARAQEHIAKARALTNTGVRDDLTAIFDRLMGADKQRQADAKLSIEALKTIFDGLKPQTGVAG